MFKKINMHNDQNSNDTKSIVCNTTAKSTLYVCPSGHVICKNCEETDDNHVNNAAVKDITPRYGDIREQRNNYLENAQDLASGDHCKSIECHNPLNCPTLRILQQHSEQSITSDTKSNNVNNTDLASVKIKFKNLNFYESESSIFPKNNLGTEEIRQVHVPRPLTCPVTQCSKMVPINSIMMHFYFDHSKVPRLILQDTQSCKLFLKSQDFSTGTQCIASLHLQKQIRSFEVIGQDHKCLLLMGVKLLTHRQICKNRDNNKMIFMKTEYTQTENFDLINKEKSKISFNKCSSVCNFYNNNMEFDQDEVLLLWLCKLNDEESIYNITLSREDKKQGYSYIGEAIHIRDIQEPTSMYDRSQCLIVKGTAINNYLNSGNRIQITINKLI